MGYTNRGSITDFWPDDTDTKMYIEDGSFFDCSIADIIEKVKQEWKEKQYDEKGAYIAPLPETFLKEYVKKLIDKLI